MASTSMYGMNRAVAAGSIALGPVAARAEWLEIACGRCDRKGRLHLASLVGRYGADYPMTRLRGELAGDCPRLRPGTQLSDLCDVFFPDLRRIMAEGTTHS